MRQLSLIEPTIITAAMLAASNVPEVVSSWSSGTTYAAGDIVGIGDSPGSALMVYESLQSANTNHSPVASPTWWVNIGETYAAWSAATTYQIGYRVLLAATHRVYESLTNSNLNNDPQTDRTNWAEVGPTNAWGMFDQAVGSVTRRASPIEVTVSPGLATAVALLDLVATSVRIQIAVGATTYYDQTHAMADGRVTGGWWGYFFEPLAPQTTLLLTGLPPVDGDITVTINNSSGTAAVGSMVVGRLGNLGDVLSSPSIGITDYSAKATDQYGVTTVVERSYAKRVSGRFNLRNDRLDYVSATLARVRATPCVWLFGGDALRDALVVYGYYGDWEIVVAYADFSEASINVKGLT